MINRIRRIFSWLTRPKTLSIINLFLILLMVSGNSYIQIFCQASFLTWCLILPVFITTIVLPQLKSLGFLSGTLLGLAFAFWIYCTVFLGHFNLYALLTVPFFVGILGLAPILFSIQIIAKLIKARSPISSFGFAFAMVTCFATCFYAKTAYKTHATHLETLTNSQTPIARLNFWNERIVGMHFIYHTQICEFDGWRPPLHDPLLNIGIRLNAFEDPLDHLSLEDRISLYKKSFPKKSVHQKRACACVESEAYHSFFNP